MSNELLEAFLAAQSDEGRYFDTAAFTIDSVKALQKLGQYQLSDSGLWLVKLVQAAVAAQASAVAIQFGHRTVSVGFEAPSDWQADALLEIVLSGVLPKDRALGHLVTAIRGCASSPNEAVRWSCGHAAVDLGATCRVTQQEPSEVFRLTATRPVRSRSWKRALTSSISDLSLQIVEERDALRSRCWVCPIPIVVDGVPMASGLDLVAGGEILRDLGTLAKKRQRADGYALSACLGLRCIHRRNFPGQTSVLPGQVRPQRDRLLPYTLHRPVYRHGTFLTWDSGQECPAAVALISHARAESSIEFIHDGVVVASHPLPELTVKRPEGLLSSTNSEPPLGVRFFFPVSQEQLDLSGFAIQSSVPVNAMLHACFPALLELTEAITKESKEFTFIPYTRREMHAVRLVYGTGVVVLGALTFGLALPFLGAGTLAYVAINRRQWRGQVRTKMKNLQDLVKDNLQARSHRRGQEG